MSFIKTQLKAARDAIQDKNYDYASGLCLDILENDEFNYNALVFLGLCYKEMDRFQESEEIYRKAIDSSPLLALAYQGFKNLKESTNDLKGQLQAWELLSSLFENTNDGKKLLDALMRRLELAKQLADDELILNCLQMFLPESRIFNLIATLQLPTVSKTLLEIIAIKEKRMDNAMATDLSERKMRLGTDPYPILKIKVERDHILANPLDIEYRQLVNCNDLDDNLRRQIEIKRLSFLYNKTKYTENLMEKNNLVNELLNLARNIVESGQFSVLALRIVIEAQDSAISERNIPNLDQFLTHISEDKSPYCRIFEALHKIHSPLTPESAQQILNMLLEALDDDMDDYYLLNGLLARVYLYLKDHRTALQYALRSQTLISIHETNFGTQMSSILTEMSLIAGMAYQELGMFPEALSLYKGLLDTQSELAEAILNLARTYMKIGNFSEARMHLGKIGFENILHLDSKLELGWIEYLENNLGKALSVFREVPNEKRSALVLYRIARIYWALGGEYRSNQEYTHAHLIQAIKLDPSFSPSFTFLGDFYRAENDILRALKCYVKSISINPSDSEGVQAITAIWIEQGKLQEATDLLQQFVELVPRSNWAWKQLGILELNAGKSALAIGKFQTSIRITPNDAISWMYLGDAMMQEGKFLASLKSLEKSFEIDSTCAPALFLKAKVYMKLQQFPESLESYQMLLQHTAALDNSLKVPIYCGVAESHIQNSRELFENGAYGCAMDSLSSVLYLLKEVADLKDSISMLKYVGDACLEMYRMMPKLISESIGLEANHITMLLRKHYEIGELLSPSESNLNSILRVLECASICFFLCCQRRRENAEVLASYLFELSRSFYYRFIESADSDALSLAVRYGKAALKNDTNNWLYWNSLAVYCHRSDPSLAQHCFIRAIESDNSVAAAWSNLGIFYLLWEDIELAGQCFQKCQFLDLDFPIGWLGQALTSQIVAYEKTFELFEHSFELARVTNVEILYQYAKHCYSHPVEKQKSFHLTNASFALQKCVEMGEKAPHIMNLYGLLLEKQSRFHLAIEILQNALDFTDEDQLKTAIHENLARCLCADTKFEESVRYFSLVLDGDAYTLTGLGLASFFSGNYQCSLEAFQNALNLAKESSQLDVRLINDVNLVLSQVLFALNHYELAKQQLFECFAADPDFVPALLSLCSLGIVQKDWILAQTAAAEMIKLEPHVLKDLDADVDYLLGYLFALSGEVDTLKRFFCKSVHRCPWKATRWSKLAEAIYTFTPMKAQICGRLSSISIIVGKRIEGSIAPNMESVQHMSNIRVVSGLSSLAQSGSSKQSRRNISRALFLQPQKAENWVAMSVDLSCNETDAGMAVRAADCASLLTESKIMSFWITILKCSAILDMDSTSLDQVQEILDQVDSVCSGSTGFIQQIAFSLLAKGLFLAGNVSAAIQALKQCLMIEDASSTNWNVPLYLLAKYYLFEGKAEKAICCLKYAQNTGDYFACMLEIVARIQTNLDLDAAFEVSSSLMRDLEQDSTARFLYTLLLLIRGPSPTERKKITKHYQILVEEKNLLAGAKDFLEKCVKSII